MHQFHHLAAELWCVGNLVLAIVHSLDPNGPVSTKPGQLQLAVNPSRTPKIPHAAIGVFLQRL
jgi:hypothetical protein